MNREGVDGTRQNWWSKNIMPHPYGSICNIINYCLSLFVTIITISTTTIINVASIIILIVKCPGHLHLLVQLGVERSYKYMRVTYRGHERKSGLGGEHVAHKTKEEYDQQFKKLLPTNSSIYSHSGFIVKGLDLTSSSLIQYIFVIPIIGVD